MTTRVMALVLVPLLTVAYAATVPFPQLRLPPAEVDAMQVHEAGSGTSGVAGIRTTVVAATADLQRSRMLAGLRSLATQQFG